MAKETQLFLTLTWEEYNRLEEKHIGQVFYITDRGLTAHCLSTNTNYLVEVMYNGGVGYSSATLARMRNLKGELPAGLFCLSTGSGTFNVYYYNGKGVNSGANWLFVEGVGGSGGGGGDVTQMWVENYVQEQLGGVVRVREPHISFDLGNENYIENSDVGNIHIQGYVEGQIDGGSW